MRSTAASVMAGSGKTRDQSPNGWFAVMSVNRRANGTPDRRAKGTPLKCGAMVA